MMVYRCVVNICPGHDDQFAAIQHGMEHIVETIDTLTAKVADMATAFDRFAADFQTLKDELAAGGITPAQQAALDAAGASLDAMEATITAEDPALAAPAAVPAEVPPAA